MNETSRYPLGIYEKALAPRPLPEMFADAAASGFQTFEISLDESDERLARLEWNDSKILHLSAAARDHDIRLYSACLSGHRRYALGSSDAAIEKRAIQILHKAIDFCLIAGIRVLQISGFDVYYEPGTQDTHLRYIDNLAAGTQRAAEAGVMLAIEPVEGHITSVRQALEVVTYIDSPWLQLYPDPANLVAMGFDAISEVEAGNGHMVALHLRDAVAGTSYNIPWGSGSLDFSALFRRLSDLNFYGPIIVEYWYEEGNDALLQARRSREFLLKNINRIDLHPES